MSFMPGLIVGDANLKRLTSVEISSKSSGGVYITYNINSDGNVLAGSLSEQWIKDPTKAGSYEVNTVMIDGALTQDPCAAGWQNMAFSHTWSLSVSPGGYADTHFLVQIRKVGTSVTLRTAKIRLTGAGVDAGTTSSPSVSDPALTGGGGGGGRYYGRVVSY